MRILQVTPFYAPAWAYGGPPRVAYELSRELVRRGHSVTVLTTDALDSHHRASPAHEISGGIEVYRLRNLSNYLAWHRQIFLPRGLATFLREHLHSFEIIHLHTVRTLQNIVVHRFATTYGIPYILSSHGSIPRIVRQRTLKAVFDWVGGRRLVQDAHRVIAQSSFEKSESEAAGAPGRKISIVLNGVDASMYENLPVRGGFIKSFGLDGQRLVTYIGRLSAGKGLDYLLTAFRDIARESKDCTLVVAGEDAGYKKQVIKLAKQFAISDRVILPGFVTGPGKLQLFVDSDLVVYPASYESFGLVPMEALLCGRPIVVSRDSGCGELIQKARAGITFPSGDVSLLRDAILIGLRGGESMSETVRRGRRFVIENLAWNHIASEMEEIYRNAIVGEDGTDFPAKTGPVRDGLLPRKSK